MRQIQLNKQIIQYKYKRKIGKIDREKNNTKNKLVINVRNNNKDGLIINNINNLNEIKGKNTTLLPWYDRHNPIIMFKYDETKIKDLNKLKNKIFNE